MTVRERLRLYHAGGSLLPAVIGVLTVGALFAAGVDVVPAFAGAIAALFASERLYPRLVEPRLRKRLLLRLNQQLIASMHDPPGARAILDEIEDGYRTLQVPRDLYLELMTGIVLAVEGRGSEARALLTSIDAKSPEDREALLQVMKALGFSDASPYR